MGRFAESVPLPRTVGSTLREDASLATLSHRMAQSRACLAAVLPVLPAALRPHLMAGPWDDQGWTLLTRQAAALTKLRQLVPLMEQALKQAGLVVPRIRLSALLSR
ncbi:MAG: hypothetical protein EBS47_03010 [Betaproteobacteria bacterium]|jgi:hypothetical protein|nr:hypothetical protein [Betaproteobacteria bacterium]NBT09422.1 hypothetical protein [Betaproteobacteria bacterium]NBU49067.1 hypothetical protein [Betaproteobacteria bacterium]